MTIPNVDASELHKFSSLAHHWWNPYGELKSLHDINPLRLEWVDGMCTLAQKHVLDVGCGGGILADAMARKGADVLGIDLAEESLHAAELHALEAQTPHIKYQCVSAEDLAAQQPSEFDVVTCMEMLEHVPDPASVVRACAELVKPGGWVFFSTINRNLKARLLAIGIAEYLLRLVPRGTHEYDRLLRPSELTRFAREAGLDIYQMIGLTYNPLTQTYRLTPDTSVNYMVAAQRSTL